MRESEALVVVGMLEAYWREFPEAKKAAWAAELLALRFEPAQEAVRRMARSSEYAPTIAAFFGYYRDEAALNLPPQPALPAYEFEVPEPVTPDEAEAIRERLREQIAKLSVARPLPPDPEPDTGDKPKRQLWVRTPHDACIGEPVVRDGKHRRCKCGWCMDPNCVEGTTPAPLVRS